MKKKVILILLLLFLNVICVQAEEYNCQYYLDEGIGSGIGDVDVTHSFSFVVNTEEKTIRPNDVETTEMNGGKKGNGRINGILDYILKDKTESEYIDLLSGGCPSTIRVCKYTSGIYTKYFMLIDNTLQDRMPKKVYYGEPDSGSHWGNIFSYDDGLAKCYPDCNGVYDYSKKPCKVFYYDDGNYSNKGKSIDIEFECKNFSNGDKTGFFDVLKKKAKKYNQCKNSEIKGCSLSEIATEYNLALEKLKTYCVNVIKTQNYLDTCMIDCLGLKDKLQQEDALIEDLNSERKCYLTQDIISMVYNVLKWAKYIVPVLVIILSILDFIKAIVSQNEDELKKAQGKFIKRLIVAAVLFLLPLLINFMLKTFGFYNENCGIENLF